MEEKNRCKWCLGIDIYEKYHDEEWGIPVYDDQKLFDYIFKGETLGIEAHEIFIDTHLKNFTHQGNF